MTESKTPFRVVIIGSGVTGLVASNCLQIAGIDHVVLEKRDDVAPPEGASIGMYPHGARVLHQIGALKGVLAACTATDRWFYRGAEGEMLMNNGFFRHVEKNFGVGYILLERREFLQILYDSLPDKSYIKTGCGVKEVKHVGDQIQVTLHNGQVETGDIVLGCDGAHSTVRSVMWEHANKITPGLITSKEKANYRTDWKAVIGVAPQMPGLGVQDMTSVSDKGRTFIAFSQADRIYFFFIFRVDKPYTWPARPSSKDADRDALVESVADHPISDTLLFGELWKKRIRGELLYLEDGVYEHWHSGRIVLTGDAVHKFTPNMGFGGNCGIESTAVLCNHLNRLLREGKGRKPSQEQLTEIFELYQNRQVPRMKEISELCRLVTKVQAWETPYHKFVDTWVFPMQSDKELANQLTEIIRRGAKLDYVDDAGFGPGTVTWIDHESATVASGSPIASRLVRLVGAGAAILAVLQGVRFFTFASASVTS
ncbi:hypothetical protein BKA67DRAFT_526716 [Truncatella angustata]|uniref:FAD-binding domain-containing protein n=1 Tax=Truncatella angustata TaxID=152316 RepID=A0A9P8RLJ9_9PEZI|nr:uncharacterized protein BKA67DRAFT_526716 [Truncatella angustata]KAH6645371.1 hypothetical protein BKA67DRAFT_526716 [Truncatella angustata]